MSRSSSEPNGRGNPPTEGLVFTHEIICELFPFHLVLDRELRIQGLGRVLTRLLGADAIGQPFGEQFRVRTPSLPLDFDAIRAQSFTVFFVELPGAGMMLKGQMLFSDTAFPDRIAFLCSPVVREFDALARLGLALGDFAIHDSAIDFLILLQTKSNTLADLGRMADRLGQEVAVRRDAEEGLREQLFFLRQLLDSIPNPVYYKDESGRYLGCNRAFAHHFGHTPDELVGMTDHDVVEAEHHFRWDRELFGSHPGVQRYEAPSVGSDGTRRDMVYYKATFAKTDGSLGGLVGVMLDITERKRMESRLNYQAHHDPLTDLPNRLLFEDRLSTALRRVRRDQSQLAMLFVDIDNFKTINDTLGHPVGDEVLRRFATRLTDALRDSDTVARLGGDEFIVLLEGIAEETDVLRITRALLDGLREPLVVEEQEFFVTVSIGAVIAPRDGSDVATLVKNADAAMYRAKESGRNGLEFYRQEITSCALERFTLEASLRHALERDELVLHYQPLICAHERRVIGAEALVRWQHPELGLLGPLRFVPLAEETGLIVPLGEWVLRTACAQVVAWERKGLVLPRISVNLSGVQMRRGDILMTVRNALAETGLPAHRLELEITEGILMRHAEEGVLDELRALGLRLSIDDFGTGYSSLAYLKRLPIEKLKIDRSFVRSLPEHNDASIVRAVIALAESLQLSVCAEGVETAAQRSFLEREGCDELQGYLFAKPLPADEFARLLAPGGLHLKPA